MNFEKKLKDIETKFVEVTKMIETERVAFQEKMIELEREQCVLQGAYKAISEIMEESNTEKVEAEIVE